MLLLSVECCWFPLRCLTECLPTFSANTVDQTSPLEFPKIPFEQCVFTGASLETLLIVAKLQKCCCQAAAQL